MKSLLVTKNNPKYKDMKKKLFRRDFTFTSGFILTLILRGNTAVYRNSAETIDPKT